MKIVDLLSERTILLDLKAGDKRGVIQELVNVLIVSGRLDGSYRTKVLNALLQREDQASTAFGGFAIPHIKTDYVREAVGVLALPERGIDFDSGDGQPVKIFFLLLSPPNPANHLKTLGQIAGLFKDPDFRTKLRHCAGSKEVLELIRLQGNET